MILLLMRDDKVDDQRVFAFLSFELYLFLLHIICIQMSTGWAAFYV